MNNLSKAKAIIKKRNARLRKERKEKESQSKRGEQAIRKARREISADMASYHGVKSKAGKLTWHPRKMELRANGKTLVDISVGWSDNVEVYADDLQRYYGETTVLRARFLGHWFPVRRGAVDLTDRVTVEYHYTEHLLEAIAEQMVKVLK